MYICTYIYIIVIYVLFSIGHGDFFRGTAFFSSKPISCRRPGARAEAWEKFLGEMNAFFGNARKMLGKCWENNGKMTGK